MEASQSHLHSSPEDKPAGGEESQFEMDILGPLGGEPQQSCLIPGRHWMWIGHAVLLLTQGTLSAFHFVNTSTYLLEPLLILSCYCRRMTLTHTLLALSEWTQRSLSE